LPTPGLFEHPVFDEFVFLGVSVLSMQIQVCANSFLRIWHSRSLFASVSSSDPFGRKQEELLHVTREVDRE